MFILTNLRSTGKAVILMSTLLIYKIQSADAALPDRLLPIFLSTFRNVKVADSIPTL